MGDDYGGGCHRGLSKGWENSRWGMIMVVDGTG